MHFPSAVSLIPSVTESMLKFGCHDSLAGVTDYCRLPEDLAEEIPRVGGPKTIDVSKIFSLRPDVVLANREENNRDQVMALIEAGLDVWISTPKTTGEAVSFLWKLASFFGCGQAAMKCVQAVQEHCSTAEHAARVDNPVPVFCPIWFEVSGEAGPWWMTFNRQTYCHDVLRLCGAANIFGQRDRKYPLEADLGLDDAEEPQGRDTRYPRVTPAEVCAMEPEMVLLPDDPYVFSEKDEEIILDELASTPAVQNGRVLRVDGRWISWYGTYTGEAAESLAVLIRRHRGR